MSSMRMLWCWHCKANIPMLDEDEFASVSHLYREALEATKSDRELHRMPLAGTPTVELFRRVREQYAELTGMELHQNAILHHRLSLYGPPCHFCGKPLRTAEAKLCGACMTPVGATCDSREQPSDSLLEQASS